MTKKISPCKCGGEAKLKHELEGYWSYWVQCAKCGNHSARYNSIADENPKDRAIEDWNQECVFWATKTMSAYDKIVKGLEHELKTGDAPIGERWGCLLSTHDVKEILNLVRSMKAELMGKVEYIDELSEGSRKLKAENERLEYTLLGVMNSVDKWLDGKELGQDDVNRAATMREKLLRIIEDRDAKIDALIAGQETLQKYIAEKNAEIEKLKKKLTLAECCICDIEDALDRGSDNDWAREHIENYEKEVAVVD